MSIICYDCGFSASKLEELCVHYYVEHTPGGPRCGTYYISQLFPTPCPWCLEKIDLPRVKLGDHLSSCALYLAWHVRWVTS